MLLVSEAVFEPVIARSGLGTFERCPNARESIA
jgi:hypothetical protein